MCEEKRLQDTGVLDTWSFSLDLSSDGQTWAFELYDDGDWLDNGEDGDLGACLDEALRAVRKAVLAERSGEDGEDEWEG